MGFRRDACFNRRTCIRCSADMQLDHLAEMEAYDGQRDWPWEQPGTAEQGPEKEPPIVNLLATTQAARLIKTVWLNELYPAQ